MKYTFHIFRPLPLYLWWVLFLLTLYFCILKKKEMMYLFFYISFLLITIINHMKIWLYNFSAMEICLYNFLIWLYCMSVQGSPISQGFLQFLKVLHSQSLRDLYLSMISIWLCSKLVTFKFDFHNFHAHLERGVRDTFDIFPLLSSVACIFSLYTSIIHSCN